VRVHLFVLTPLPLRLFVFDQSSVSQVYSQLLERVRKVNASLFSQGDPTSRLPIVRRTRRKTFGLNGPQFFGIGLDHVRKMLESRPSVEAVVAPLTSSSPQYRFCFIQPPLENVKDLIRKRAAAKHEKSLENARCVREISASPRRLDFLLCPSSC